MGVIWKLLKVAIVLAIAIPLCFVAFAVTAGIVGTLLRLALLAFRVAFFGAIVYVGYRVVRGIFGRPKAVAPPVRALPPVDPYYQAALRELDAEIGSNSR